MKRKIQVGDLVKFRPNMQMPGCLGIVVALNGEAFDVQWTDEASRRASRYGGEEISAELPEFLEVLSESR
jgi:hypothetical protein